MHYSRFSSSHSPAGSVGDPAPRDPAAAQRGGQRPDISDIRACRPAAGLPRRHAAHSPLTGASSTHGQAATSGRLGARTRGHAPLPVNIHQELAGRPEGQTAGRAEDAPPGIAESR